jgi:hypothetical protein
MSPFIRFTDSPLLLVSTSSPDANHDKNNYNYLFYKELANS